MRFGRLVLVIVVALWAAEGATPLVNFLEPTLVAWRVEALGTCQGNACKVFTISSNGVGKGFTLTNHSKNRRVRVSIQFTFGLQCQSATIVDLNPGQSRMFGNGAFCNPYSANYL